MQPSNQQPGEEWQQPHESPSRAPYQPVAPVEPLVDDGVGEPVTMSVYDDEPTREPVNDTVDEADDSDQLNSDDIALLRWEAPEYHQHARGARWYMIFALITIILMAVSIVAMHAWTFTILIAVMAVAVVMYTRRPPEVIRYTLSRKGLHINDKLFAFSQFKSFGVLTHNGLNSVVIVPRKRFQLGQTLYFPTEVGEQLVDMLASRLPMKEVEPNAIDRLLARLHL